VQKKAAKSQLNGRNFLSRKRQTAAPKAALLIDYITFNITVIDSLVIELTQYFVDRA
jgi:hypothetical protein